MEWELPWRPSPLASRAGGVRLYVEGERLCDAGETAAGISLLRQAGRQLWELEQQQWPGWALELYARFTGARELRDEGPPLLCACTASWQPEISRLAPSPSGEWWRSPSACDAISFVLERRGVALVDGFGGELLTSVRAECLTAYADGGELLAIRSACERHGEWVESRV